MLRGNPHQVADVADTLQFEHKYTSGVIAWAAVQENGWSRPDDPDGRRTCNPAIGPTSRPPSFGPGLGWRKTPGG